MRSEIESDVLLLLCDTHCPKKPDEYRKSLFLTFRAD